MLQAAHTGHGLDDVPQVSRPRRSRGWSRAAGRVHVSDEVFGYIVALVAHTRSMPSCGSAPAPAVRSACCAPPGSAPRSRAGTSSSPATCRRSPVPVLAHRVLLAPSFEASGGTTADAVREAVEAVPGAAAPVTLRGLGLLCGRALVALGVALGWPELTALGAGAVALVAPRAFSLPTSTVASRCAWRAPRGTWSAASRPRCASRSSAGARPGRGLVVGPLAARGTARGARRRRRRRLSVPVDTSRRGEHLIGPFSVLQGDPWSVVRRVVRQLGGGTAPRPAARVPVGGASRGPTGRAQRGIEPAGARTTSSPCGTTCSVTSRGTSTGGPAPARAASSSSRRWRRPPTEPSTSSTSTRPPTGAATPSPAPSTRRASRRRSRSSPRCAARVDGVERVVLDDAPRTRRW